VSLHSEASVLSGLDSDTLKVLDSEAFSVATTATSLSGDNSEAMGSMAERDESEAMGPMGERDDSEVVRSMGERLESEQPLVF
jgi:hypothetical protein